MNKFTSLLGLLLLTSTSPAVVKAADAPFTRQEDVVYGRKFGMALTLDTFTPKQNANGAAVIFVVSGGWYSDHNAVNTGQVAVVNKGLLERGYMVFNVVHASNPRFTITDAIADINRAVRFIRARATEYKIDPNRIGITGMSAGGHLSLMQGVAGTLGDAASKDPIEKQSSRVQAVACFYPPTDFLNYGKAGENAMGRGILKDFRAPFEFQRFDFTTRTFVPVTDEAQLLDIGRQVSPITHITADDPPTLIIHGDADKLVPIQQGEIFVAKLKEAGVPAQLNVMPGVAHGWDSSPRILNMLLDWFDKYLPAGKQ